MIQKKKRSQKQRSLLRYKTTAPCGIGQTRQQSKDRRDREAGKVVKSVRAQCVERDGYCRINPASGGPRGDSAFFDVGPCSGPSQWAHLGEKTRAKTRGQAPEVRHTTGGSLMACRHHHDRIDGRARPRIYIDASISRGANGPLDIWEARVGACQAASDPGEAGA